ncbi:hypothetical protein EMWEY_00059270, partial [Eimeria maxima]
MSRNSSIGYSQWYIHYRVILVVVIDLENLIKEMLQKEYLDKTLRHH